MAMVEQRRDLEVLLARYADGPDQLEAALVDFKADLDLSLKAGTWTIRQLVHHVVDGDDFGKSPSKPPSGTAGGSSAFGGTGTNHRMSGRRIGIMRGGNRAIVGPLSGQPSSRHPVAAADTGRLNSTH
jgi:hypothetical protein